MCHAMPKSKNNKNRGKNCGTKTKINEYSSQSHGARKNSPCSCCYMLNHVKLNSPPMVFVSTTEGNQRSSQHGFSCRSRHKPNKTKISPSVRSPSPSMLHPPPCFPAVKREIQTENRLSYPRIPPASFPWIKGSQQCSNT